MRRRRLIMMLSGAFRFLKSIKIMRTVRKAGLTQAPGKSIATARQIKTSRSADIIGFPSKDMAVDEKINSSHNSVASSHDTTTLSVYRKASLGKKANLFSYGIGQLRFIREIYTLRKANPSSAPGTTVQSNRKMVLSVPAELEAARTTNVSVKENMLAEVKMDISQSPGLSIVADSIAEERLTAAISPTSSVDLAIHDNIQPTYRAELVTWSYPEQTGEKLLVWQVYGVTQNGSRLELT